MLIGERLRILREGKKYTQGDMERRTGLLRCYISRVEHGHTVPSVSTLEKLARALEIPMYQLMYDGEELPSAPATRAGLRNGDSWGFSGRSVQYLAKLRRALMRMQPEDRKLLLLVTHKMVNRKR